MHVGQSIIIIENENRQNWPELELNPKIRRRKRLDKKSILNIYKDVIYHILVNTW